MNLARHILYLYSPIGELMTVIMDGMHAGLSYTLKECEAGVLDILLPWTFDRNFLKVDGQFEIYRTYAAGGMHLEGDTGWFIRHWMPSTDQEGRKVISVRAYSALEIAKRRIIPYIAGSSYAEKIGMPWDDMLREIVDENFGPGASYAGASYGDDPVRNIEPWLTVEPDLSFGASFPSTHGFAWRNVYNALMDITDEVRANGTYCTFDIVRVSPGHYEFRVFIGPRGMDHSADSDSPVMVSEARHNLTGPALEEDWQEEHNFIYAAGQGQEEDRVVRTAQDDGRINLSPFNRREFLDSATNLYIPDSVQDSADASLESGRPHRRFTGGIQQTEGCIYGVHWGWGDIVTAQYQGYNIDCHVDAVTVDVGPDGTEMVTGYLRSEEDINMHPTPWS